jgi:hypothetical protein
MIFSLHTIKKKLRKWAIISFQYMCIVYEKPFRSLSLHRLRSIYLFRPPRTRRQTQRIVITSAAVIGRSCYRLSRNRRSGRSTRTAQQSTPSLLTVRTTRSRWKSKLLCFISFCKCILLNWLYRYHFME